jgi:hypothetical protein
MNQAYALLLVSQQIFQEKSHVAQQFHARSSGRGRERWLGAR